MLLTSTEGTNITTNEIVICRPADHYPSSFSLDMCDQFEALAHVQILDNMKVIE